MGTKRVKRALKLESFEKRELMAVDFSNGVLTLTGSSRDDDFVFGNYGDKLWYAENGKPTYSQIPIREITRINANLGAGRDQIAINQNGHFNDLLRLDSLNVNFGSGGNGGGRESIVFQGESVRNFNVRGSTTDATTVNLWAKRVDNVMIDLGRQQLDDDVTLQLQRAGRVDVRTYDGNDVVKVGHWDYFGAPAMTINRLAIDTGNGNDYLNLRGGVINAANIQMGGDNDWVEIGHWAASTIRRGVIDGGTNSGDYGDTIRGRHDLNGGVTVRGMERDL